MLRLLLFILLNTSILSAQYVPLGEQCVIATSGLNLRADANTSGKVIASIPFGGSVFVFDPCDYGVDTIGRLKDYYRVHDHLDSSTTYADHHITGTWFRVAVGSDTGFVFNAYLGYCFDEEAPVYRYTDSGETIPEDYLLIYPGGGCGGEVYSPNVYNFYGVYASINDQNALRAIDISYLMVTDDLEALLITTDDNRGLRFIIASKDKLKPHKFSGEYFNAPARVHANPAAHDHDHDDHLDIPLPSSITYDTAHTYGYPLIQTVTLDKEGITQLLTTQAYATEIQLNGVGDIDGDGRPDYVIGYSGEKESRVTLYLSSLAEAGEVVKEACNAWFSCCC